MFHLSVNKLDEDLVEFVELLRIAAFLQRNVAVLNRGAKTHLVGNLSRNLQVEIRIDDGVLVVPNGNATRDASRSAESFERAQSV